MTHPFIPLSVPHFCGNEDKYVNECLKGGWISTAGSFVGRFEESVARTVGVKEAVAVVNGTAALHTALLVSGVKPDDEVLAPPLTFIAPVNAIRYAGAHPVFIDVDPKTWQIDPAQIAKFLEEECDIEQGFCINKKSGRRVQAIMAVHLLGLSCDMDPIIALAKKYNLRVIEDAAEAMGVRYKGRHVGVLGDAGALSFNGNKVVTTGGGGVVLLNDPSKVKYARYLTTQAKDDPLESFHNEVGYNYRLTNIHAAIGVAQMEQIAPFLEKKRAIAAYYAEILKEVEGITLMPRPDYCEATYWLYTILLNEKTTLEKRKNVLKTLNEKGVGARAFWHPIHRLPPYQKNQAYHIEHAVRLYERGICLPSSVGLESTDLERVVRVLKESL